jgi:hypothetical protein
VTPADSGIEHIRRLRPDAAAALDEALEQAFRATPPGLLELCRERIRMLLGTPLRGSDRRAGELADYASSPIFDDLERTALEFTEQYVMDVAAMPDELVARLRDHLGTVALYSFVMALYAVDQAERLELSGTVHPGAVA